MNPQVPFLEHDYYTAEEEDRILGIRPRYYTEGEVIGTLRPKWAVGRPIVVPVIVVKFLDQLRNIYSSEVVNITDDKLKKLSPLEKWVYENVLKLLKGRSKGHFASYYEFKTDHVLFSLHDEGNYRNKDARFRFNPFLDLSINYIDLEDYDPTETVELNTLQTEMIAFNSFIDKRADLKFFHKTSRVYEAFRRTGVKESYSDPKKTELREVMRDYLQKRSPFEFVDVRKQLPDTPSFEMNRKVVPTLDLTSIQAKRSMTGMKKRKGYRLSARDYAAGFLDF